MTLRPTLTIEYGGETKELKVNFDLIDRVRAKVAWERLAIELSGANGQVIPNFSLMTNFVYYNLVEAGFSDISKDEIYDEMVGSTEGQLAYIDLIGQIMSAYQPTTGTKKKPKLKKLKKKI